jgi:hypothetical protein
MLLIAQALGEYGATSAISSGLSTLSIRAEEFAGEYGLETIVVLIVAIMIWRVITAVR